MCFLRRFAYSTGRKPNRCQTLPQNHMNRLQQVSSAPTLSEQLEWLTRAPKRKWAAHWGTLWCYCLLSVSAVIWGGQKNSSTGIHGTTKGGNVKVLVLCTGECRTTSSTTTAGGTKTGTRVWCSLTSRVSESVRWKTSCKGK